jgi:hypothetical protein
LISRNSRKKFYPDYTTIDTSIWVGYAGEFRFHKNIQSTILEYINRETIREYWDEKGRIKAELFPTVYWDSVRKVMQTSTIQTRNWIIKRVAHNCAANVVLIKRNRKIMIGVNFVVTVKRYSMCISAPTGVLRNYGKIV